MHFDISVTIHLIQQLHFRQQFERSEWKRSKVLNTEERTQNIPQPYTSKRTPTATVSRADHETSQRNTATAQSSGKQLDRTFQSTGHLEHAHVNSPSGNYSQMGESSSSFPRFHPYQRRQPALPSHGQVNNVSRNNSDNSSHSYNGYSRNTNQSYSATNSGWHGNDESSSRPSQSVSFPETHPGQPPFQKIKLSSKFLK